MGQAPVNPGGPEGARLVWPVLVNEGTSPFDSGQSSKTRNLLSFFRRLKETTVLKWILNGLVVLLIGGAFWIYQDERASVSGGDASFAFLIWIIFGLPVSFILYPLAYRGSQYLARPLRWIALPAVVMAVVLVVAIQPDEPTDDLFLVQFAIAVQLSWVLYVRGVDNWPRSFDGWLALLFMMSLAFIFGL